MTPLPPDLVFRTPLDRGVAWPKHRSALDACQDLQARSEDADGVSLWHGGSTEVLVTEQLILAVAGKPRRQVPHATWGRWSEPIGGAEIARLWLRDGPECVAQITSSFALVIFERRERRTHLAVDPFGLASLFWRVADGELWICTEQAPLVGIRPTPRLDRLALPDVFNLRFLSGSRTLWTDLNQVLPGTLVTVEEDQVRRTEMRRIRFEPQDETPPVPQFAARMLTCLAACFGQQHDEGKRDAGVLLSGGIDSSIIAAVAARTFPRCIAYSARIEGFANPELPRAAEVARRLGIEHRIVEVGQNDLARLFPFVMARVQEPPRHFNNLVLVALYEAMSSETDVVVAGDAADCLLGGAELAMLRRLARKRRLVQLLPKGLQESTGRALSRSANKRAKSLGRVLRFNMDQLIQRLDLIPRSRNSDELLRPVVRSHGPSDEIVAEHFRRGPGYFETFQQWDLSTFLTSIFRRNHRLSAPFGLRIWYPLLEPAIVELATRMSRGLKIDPVTGESKPVLREICATMVGRDVAGWSKMGFPSPERELIAGPLRAEWAACTGPDALVSRLFDPALLGKLDPSVDHQTAWTLLTLEHLLRRQGAGG